ncbi:MAG: tagaturonate epimerase family protein, partial [Bacteroidota bacterium]
TAFKQSCAPFGDSITVPGIDEPVVITEDLLDGVAARFLAAVQEAGKIYRRIESVKGTGNFITEVSMDEVDSPQTPVDMLFILKMIADLGIPAQTIAPKFTGRFNKGVDYVGDVDQFAREFEQDILVIDYAVKNFGLPENLKLSVHSGSDKFTIYPVMADIIRRYDKGLHVKTAGTTWLEEVIGLALAGGEALKTAKEIYTRALARKEELCGPYADVIDIDEARLPSAEEVSGWDSEKFANTLRHIPGHPDYNPNFRQLIHVGYKVASEMGARYTGLLKQHRDIVGACVEENIYDRHLKRLFNL